MIWKISIRYKIYLFCRYKIKLQNGGPPIKNLKIFNQKSYMIWKISIRYKIYCDFSTILGTFEPILAILPGHRHLIASCRVRFTSLLIEYKPAIYCIDLLIGHSVHLILPRDTRTDSTIVLWHLL